MEPVGRRAETAALDRLLHRAARGAGSGLVLWGEPGIGKTALLDHAAEAAADATVLRCRGTRIEAGLAFAALHELLWPVADRMDTLPAAQAAALRGALGMSLDPADRFLIGAAVLSLLSGLARERPVLVVVDDAQWVDEATAHCLGFVARRVRTDPVVVLLTGHENPASGPWEGLPALEVAGLADDDARRLVHAVVPDADESLVEHTVRTAGGNPLALHELPALGRGTAGEARLPPPGEPVRVGPRLRRAFRARAQALKPPTRALLLLAAAEDRGERRVVHRAGAAWELLPPVPLAQAWGVEGGLLDVLHVQAAQLRRRHELTALALVLSQTAVLDLAAGRWEAAGTAAAEGLRLAGEVGADHVATRCRASLAALAAARGDGRTVGELTARVLEVSVPRGVRVLSAAAYWYRGRAALFAGRPRDALADLLCLAEPGHEAAHPTSALFAAADTVEAAAQAGGTDAAGPRAAMVAEWARRTGASWARTAAHRLQALVAGGPAAEDPFRAALDTAGAAGCTFEYARTRLLYGEWLRRARRRADARHELAAAAEVFDRPGAEPLRARALRERALTQRPAPARGGGPPAAAGLTAQELRVARLAADGLTNREIGAQLLISPRTVGHHLAGVYPKLGITSRAELARIDFAGDLRLKTAGD